MSAKDIPEKQIPNNKVSLTEKFALFDEHWSPKILAEANGQLVKIAKGQGQLVWHSHDNEDELFIVFKGCLQLHIRNNEGEVNTVSLNSGELFVVPKGVEHCPQADEETHFMMLEPASTQHTGSVNSEQTVKVEQQAWI